MLIKAREVNRGDELELRDWPPEFVRSAQVVLHMSNGMDVTLGMDDQVDKINE